MVTVKLVINYQPKAKQTGLIRRIIFKQHHKLSSPLQHFPEVMCKHSSD